MNLLVLGLSALSLFACADGEVIGHDEVVPFEQPAPTTLTDKVGVKFKPQIHISGGCHPYPAVDKDGNTGGGLKPSGSSSGGCKGSDHGSQIYGRAKWYSDKWAIVYAWYFPKNGSGIGTGSRHWWLEMVVWIDNPAFENPTILAVTPWHRGKYAKYVPPSADTLNGRSTKVDYASATTYGYTVDVIPKAGETQDLIM